MLRVCIKVFIVCLAAGIAQGSVKTWWESLLYPGSHEPTFPDSKLYNISVGFPVSQPGVMMAYGDFNGDKFTDVFVISTKLSLLQIYIWNRNSFKFTQMDDTGIPIPQGSTFTSVVPGDYNFDGRLDLLVTETNSTNPGAQVMKIYFGDLTSIVLEPIMVGVASDQVLVLEANGDLYPDIFGTDVQGNRVIWFNPQNTTGDWQTHTFDAKLPPLVKPNSNAFVDINGDCISDLLMQSTTKDTISLEIWLSQYNSTEGGLRFNYTQEFPLPQGTGQFTFQDWDGDGTIDILFPVCKQSAGKACTSTEIHVIYNQQERMCKSVWDTSNCRGTSSLCSPDYPYSLPPMNVTTGNGDVVIFTLEDGYNINSNQIYSSLDYPVYTIRSGDYNLDGYFDLLIPVVSNGVMTVQLWENVPCSDDLFCTSDAIQNNRRTFQLVQGSEVSALSHAESASIGSFFDLDNNGKQDIFLVVGKNITNFNIVTLYNNIKIDAYYLSALGLNGRCPAWCHKEGGPSFPDPKPYGVNFAGGVFKFGITGSNGNKRPAVSTALTQSGYNALQTPYVLFGLGKTSAYIDTLMYGMPIYNGKKDSYLLYQLGIIPNSHIVCFPYPANKPSRWKLEMYLAPSNITFWVIIACAIACLILAIVIIVLDYMEGKQDKKEAEEKAHLFSFNAL